jgi:hypothetical protein
MSSLEESQTALNRLLAVKWKIDGDRVAEHIPLARETLRRLALWAGYLNCVIKWPNVDVALHLYPSMRASQSVIDSLRTHLQNVDIYPDVPRLLEYSLHWSIIKQMDLAQKAKLPDPYEPVILLYEHMGSFHHNFEDLIISLSKVLGANRWVGYNSLPPQHMTP